MNACDKIVGINRLWQCILGNTFLLTVQVAFHILALLQKHWGQFVIKTKNNKWLQENFHIFLYFSVTVVVLFNAADHLQVMFVECIPVCPGTGHE